MKKLFLLLGIVALSLSSWAEGTPYVIVHKSNGGFLAWLNLYNNIDYTPSENENSPAVLNCTGSGWSFCRVPRYSLPSTQANLPNLSNSAVQNALYNTINSIIEFSENCGQKGNLSGSKSTTISVPTGCRENTTYVVKGTWSYNAYGEGTIYFYVNNLDNSIRR